MNNNIIRDGNGTEYKDQKRVSSVRVGAIESKKITSVSTGSLFENKIAREQNSLEKTEWLNSSEAAQYLRVSVNSIKTMVYRGQIRVHKLGRRSRFHRHELERMIVLPAQSRR